jgi:hypothetical protein
LRRKSGVRISIVVPAPRRGSPDHRGEMRRAAIGQVVAVDRGDDDMRRPSVATASATRCRLGRVERAGQAGRHVAEGAGAGAGLAHDHHGGVALAPALADIRAGRFLAHGHQPFSRIRARVSW